MVIKWNDDLLTGVATIDGQHKDIFARMNNLLNAMSQGKGRDEVGNLLSFLGDYIVQHFKAEEAIMTKYNYSEYPTQHTEHTRFTNDIATFKKKFETGGATSSLVITVQQELYNWLMNHISNLDKKLGQFLKDSGYK